ncbi:MAG TPA: virulence RhuM family protein [Pyrinomonadaceae bacterium]|nr:virulence RhuM family protein [Pyrinomonadaceae bacterium]
MEEKDEISTYGEMIVYQMEDEDVRLRVRLENETIWLTQMAMAELFQTTKQNISQHIRNVFDEGELEPDPTVKKFLTVQREGSREIGRELEHYNLDVVISVGYRIKSVVATRFRIWATNTLKEYVIKGFVMDDERLKNPPGKDVPDYFDEMLARIRDIRASEKRAYLRVKEIFAMAADYAPNDAETSKFFSIIQNKLHFASTGKTAAEIISSRANHELPNMGLTSWKADEVRKTDVVTAKNYLSEAEIDELNRIVVMWLDFAEDQAKRRKQVFMANWEQRLDDFLEFNERRILGNAGKVSKDEADKFAKSEFDKFAKRRRSYKEELAEREYIAQLEEAGKKIQKSNEP